MSSTLHSTPKKASLPDDILLSIVARVPRLYYQTISLVSKSFRSLLASPELYKARSLLGHTESCLYVCLQFIDDKTPTWYTLCRKPDQTKKKKSSEYVLVRAPIPDSPCGFFSGLVAVGSDIYNIGVSRDNYQNPTSRVSILDCRSHTWRQAPSLRVEPESLSASVLDQKIYVAGYYKDSDNSWKNLFEVLDTRSQTWDHEPIPWSETKGKYHNYKTACIDGKFHVATLEKVVAYDSKEGKWDLVQPWMMGGIKFSDSYCEIDNVLYSVGSNGDIRWYDTEVGGWRLLKGLVWLPNLPSDAFVRLAGYGGNMAVLWEEYFGIHTVSCKKRIWCAEIALERRKSCEIWGKVKWSSPVLTVPT